MSETEHPWAGQERRRLQELMDGERVRLGIHIRKMNSPGSPVYRTSENVVPAAAILIGSFAATAIHFYLGAAVLAVGCWWWIARILPQIREAVFLRASAYVLESDAHFDQMWARGMLSLYTKLPDGSERAAAQRDDWRAFIRALQGVF